jgi:hypothetical protein
MLNRITLPSPAVFFYGTLMHPLILTRVLGHQDPELEFQDAILLVSTSGLLQARLALLADCFSIYAIAKNEIGIRPRYDYRATSGIA